MGHRKTRAPRHGSLAYYPRKRAKITKGKIKTWPNIEETILLGFAGFKAGMTHIAYIEQNANSPYKDQEIFCPVTIIETPPLLMMGIRVYSKSNNGLKSEVEILSKDLIENKYLLRKITLPSSIDHDEKMNKIQSLLDDGMICEVRGIFATQPHLSSLSRKKPDIIEIKIGGKTQIEAFNFAKENLGKEIRIWDVFKNGQVIDVSAISKGKGFQGPIKRFGIHRLQHKSRKAVRAVACIGPWHPARVMWTVPRAGQTGFHQRTEYNKQIMKISEKGEEVTPNGGFVNYGLVKGDYVMIKGSVPGPKKRLIRFRRAIRSPKQLEAPEITYVNLSSQQMK